ncbi:leucine-rich repeat-containing protein 56-like isoform X3 [Salmo trutta]|uniref:leucine-rich repeat-containing protein 56-like isoform X3 n=1 Tax=Salmo trutta TaxID=8032 RepID=UPI001131BC0E|nr:leucine-rich repeat-containing protein 56-like isoform X3 [Salmo trutta]
MFCCDTSTLASGSWLCRDLGTTLSHLQVLWISHYSLADLDGVPSSSLKELYVAYNRVSDLSQSEEEEGYCYRSAVRELVPQLHYLDYMCAEEKAGPGCTSSMGEDWALLRESIKDCSCTEMAQGVCVCVFLLP